MKLLIAPRWAVLALLGVMVVCPVGATATDSTAAIRITAPAGAPDLVTIEVTGLPAAALNALVEQATGEVSIPRGVGSSLLCVTMLEDPARDPAELPCALGRWWIENQALRFRPRFPPAPGLTLTVRFDGPAFDQRIGVDGQTPALTERLALPTLDRQPSTTVEAMYPSGEILPANLLRIYLHFSAPMSAFQVVPHIRLVDVESAQAIDTAFVPIDGGLWDPDRTRLTLLVHPGRIKRGVGPHQAMGPVLAEDRHYRLEVRVEARDADGLPLRKAFARTFRVGSPDRRSPDPTRWNLTAPLAPDDPLIAELIEPVDHALLERMPFVVDAGGQPILGTTFVSLDERRWTFQPAEPWRPGPYRLIVPAELEDPSGNRVDHRFEEAPASRDESDGPLSLEFEVP